MEFSRVTVYPCKFGDVWVVVFVLNVVDQFLCSFVFIV